MKCGWVLVLVGAVLCMQVSFGQDLKKVDHLIVSLEDSLKTMIDKDGADRKVYAASMREQVDHLKMLIARKDSPDTLERKKPISEPKYVSARMSPDVSALALQLSTLVCELKTTIEEEKAALRTSQKPQPTVPPALQVGGSAYTYFTYSQDGTDGPGANRFDFDRIYLTAKSQLFDGGKFVFTTDIYRNTVAGSYYNGLGIRVKYGYLELALSNAFTMRAGMIPTQWAAYIDQFWKYRGVAQTIVDKQNYFSSADLGVSVSYALPENFGEVTGFIFNGGGYTNPETNRYKDLAARVSLTPFTGTPGLQALTIAGYAYVGANVSTVSTALERDRFGGMISYTYSIATATAEFHVRRDALTNADSLTKGNGLSVFGEVRAPFEAFHNKVSMIWRYDIVDPNLDKGEDMQRFGILGVSYKLNEKVNFVADYQGTIGESALFKRPDGVKTDADKRWFMHLILTY
jgi:hypothetical protein